MPVLGLHKTLDDKKSVRRETPPQWRVGPELLTYSMAQD